MRCRRSSRRTRRCRERRGRTRPKTDGSPGRGRRARGAGCRDGSARKSFTRGVAGVRRHRPASHAPVPEPAARMGCMTRFARDERRALCDTLLSTGPDAPTLCEGWTTRDLAAHLVLRDRRPDAELGRQVPFLAGHAAAVRDGVRGTEWTELVDLVRSGPPVWSPARLGRLDEAMNTAEMFVHHEDVRRAQPEWSPRSLPEGLEAA